MREILFRGKRIDNGEWVYGAFWPNTLLSDLTIPRIIDRDGTAHKVDHSTVGQWTGLTDKNGKRIFEGDVVRTKKYGKTVKRSNVNDFDTFRVTYTPCMFRLEREDPFRGFNLVGPGTDFEVVGNIHDNPKLIGGR